MPWASVLLLPILASASPGCGLSSRQIDIAEAYTASVRTERIERALQCETSARDTEACHALRVRASYEAMLQAIVDKESEPPLPGQTQVRPRGYATLMRDLRAYRDALRGSENFGDATRINSVIADFNYKLVAACGSFDKLLVTSLRVGTKLLQQIDALTNERLTDLGGDPRVRDLDARLTDIHFATQAELSGHRSCRRDNEKECREVYDAICEIGVLASPEERAPHVCTDSGRPRWAR